MPNHAGGMEHKGEPPLGILRRTGDDELFYHGLGFSGEARSGKEREKIKELVPTCLGVQRIWPRWGKMGNMEVLPRPSPRPG